MAATYEEERHEERRAANAKGLARRRAERDASCSLRACMCCKEPFLSEGAHNRLCAKCGNTARNVGVDFDYLFT